MSVENLRAKRCLITGAASGIGRATALAAAARGAELFSLPTSMATVCTASPRRRSGLVGPSPIWVGPTSPITTRSSPLRKRCTETTAAWTW